MDTPDYLASMVASTEDVIICTDRDGRITYWNPSAARLLGYSPTEVAGTGFARLLAPEDHADEATSLTQLWRGEDVPCCDRVLIAKDGVRHELSVTASAIRDAAGDVIGCSKIGRPIGGRRQFTVAALHLAALVESSDDVIVSKNLDGIVQSWNPAAERLFGYTAAEMIGQSITKIIPVERLGEEDFVLGRIRAGRSVEHFETVRLARDGTPIDISLTVSPIRDATGRVVGASKIARDIRDQKRLLDERQAAAASEEAARREVLEAQNQRIQEASRLKSEFVANMSHELRTPLNSIVGFAELIADAKFGPLPERYQQFAHIMNASAQHLLQLINDILDLAKVESGKIDFQPEPVDLVKLTGEAVAIVSGLAAKRKLQLSAEIDPSLRTVNLDPMRLKQVLYNYLSNAIKFTPEGGRVTLRVRPFGDDAFRIEVEDTGIGIRTEEEHRLFVEFQQLDASTAKRFGGSGLGLALTKRLVEAQGGTVGFQSAFGEGSTFVATLPRQVAAVTTTFSGPAARTA